MICGDIIRHNKRGTDYRIIGTKIWSGSNLQDNENVVFVKLSEGRAFLAPVAMLKNFAPIDLNILIPMQAQVSVPLNDTNRAGAWTIYQQVDGPLTFARPTREFTPERFTVLT